MVKTKRSFYTKLLFSLLFTISVFLINNYKTSAESLKHSPNVQQSQTFIPKVSERKYESNIRGVKDITPNQIMKKVSNKNNFILFVGYKECKYCRAFSIELKKFISLSKEKVYYLDLDKVRSKNNRYKYNQKFVNFIQRDLELDGTPTIAALRKGKVDQNLNYSGYGFKLKDLMKLISNDNRKKYVKKLTKKIHVITGKIKHEKKIGHKNTSKIQRLTNQVKKLKKELYLYTI